MIGTIEAMGRNITTDSTGQRLTEGDRIAYFLFQAVSTLLDVPERGNRGGPNRYRDWLGVSSEQPPHFHGAYGEYYYMKPGHWVFKVPDELSDALVSPINCALSEVIYGLNQIGITLGDTVVIQGAGGLGLYATAVAREMGAGKIIVLDRLPARLSLAREFGADETLNVDEIDMKSRVEYVLDETRGIGADLVAEFVGSPRVLAEGVEDAPMGRTLPLDRKHQPRIPYRDRPWQYCPL